METVAQHLTREGRVFGTASYMSPEQARGQVVDTRSDLFSFGVMLYEMVTGELPFTGETISDTISAVLRDTVVPALERNPGTPPELDRILSRLLQKRADERYQSSRDLMLELKQLERATDSGSYTTEAPSGSGPFVASSTTTGMGPTGAPSYGSSTGSASGPHAAKTSGPLPAAGSRWRPIVLGGLAIASIIVAGVVASVVRPLIAGRDDARPAVAVPASVSIEPGAVAVHALENLKDPDDPDRLGQILQELIITDLSSVEPLRVFSSQRLYDIQKRLTGRDERVYDRETATEVAQYAGAELMLTGTISQLGNRWILLSQLVDVESGTIDASERIDGTDLYEMVDQLTDRIRGRLDMSASAAGSLDKDVKEMTTSSIEAYRHYLRGVDLLNAQEFEGAVAELDSAIAIDADFSRAYYSLALAHWWARHGTEAARAPLQRLLSGELEISDKERGMAEGTFLLVDSQYEEALPTFERLVEQYPDEKDIWYMLGECYYHKSGPARNRALRAFVRSVKLDPEFFLGYSHIFDIYDASGMMDEALALSRVLVDLAPDNAEYYQGWIEYTAIASDEASLDAAIAEAQARFPGDLDRARIMLSVARAFYRIGRYDAAREAYTAAASSSDEGVALSGELGIARVDVALLAYDSAEAHLKGLLAARDGDTRESVVRPLVDQYHELGRYEDGLALLDRYADQLRDEFTTVGRCVFRLAGPEGMTDAELADVGASFEDDALRVELFDVAANIFAGAGDYERMDRYLAKVDSISPGANENDIIQISNAALALGDVARAEQLLGQGLATNPANAEIRIGLAEAALLRNAPEDAAEQAVLAVDSAPYGKRSRRMLIRSLLRAERWAEADEALERARAEMPASLFGWVLVGSRGNASRGVAFAYARAGDVDRARALVAEAATLIPSSPDVAHAEGWIALAAGDVTTAERAFRRGREQSKAPSFDSSRMEVGLAASRLVAGDAKGAERMLLEHLTRAPRHVRDQRLVAYTLAAQERFDEAAEYARRALSMDPGAESHAALAWVLVRGGLDVSLGESLAQTAEGSGPGWSLPVELPFVAPPEHTLGLAALRQGRLAEAVRRLEEAARAHPERASIARHLEEARVALRDAQG